MNESLFLLVSAVIVAITTGAPVANQDNVAPAASIANSAEDMIMVGKRADEMVYYGNQQNEPRVPMKKSQPPMLQSVLKSPEPLGEVDQGAKVVAHEEIPVEEDLNDRAEAVRGESDLDRLAEGLKVAEEQVEEADEGEQVVKDKKEDDNYDGEENTPDDAMKVDLPESGEDGDEVSMDEVSPIADMEQNNNEGSDDNGDDTDEELASLSNEADSSSEEEENSDDGDDSNDEDVEEFLDELRKESEDRDGNEVEGEGTDNDLKGYKEESQNGMVDPNYYQTLYHILANTYNGADDYYNNYNNMVEPSYYLRLRRSPSLRRRDLASIRSRRNNKVRRIKRDLPTDWLAAYRGLDIPYSSDVQDSLLSEPEESYEEEDPVSEELSRYIYANLLNKLYGDGLQAEVEEEIPYEEILPYELGPEVPESVLEEYEPEEILYDPEVPQVYRENPYEEYVPKYAYAKRSGAGFYPDSRRKRYFYPFYEEPETHWGAFVPEKRGNYDDALQRLQRLAFALSDNPRPYYG